MECPYPVAGLLVSVYSGYGSCHLLWTRSVAQLLIGCILLDQSAQLKNVKRPWKLFTATQQNIRSCLFCLQVPTGAQSSGVLSRRRRSSVMDSKTVSGHRESALPTGWSRGQPACGLCLHDVRSYANCDGSTGDTCNCRYCTDILFPISLSPRLFHMWQIQASS